MSDVTEFPALRYNPQEVAQRGFGMASSGATDDRLIVGFLQESVLNQFKSRELGVPFYEDRTFVKIQHPGETLNIVKRPVRDDDKRRWPRQWAQFEAGVSQVPDGIPISLLFPANPSIPMTLKGYNIHTIEQLANLSAQGIATVGMGCTDWVNGAKRYMEHAEKGVSHHKFESELAAFKSENAKLQRQIAELTALVHRREKPTGTPQHSTGDIDIQTQMVNATHQSNEGDLAPPAHFHTDLSSNVQPKRRGRPPGSKNKEQN